MEENKLPKKKSVFKIIRRVIMWIFLCIIALLLSVYLLMKIPAVQDWTAQKVASYLQNKIHSKVEIGDVTIDLFKHIILNDVYIEDLQQDTLIFSKRLEVNLGAINPFAPSVKIKNLQLNGAYVNLYRNLPDTVFNYQFISDAFASEDEDTSSSKPMDINLQRLIISNTKFRMYDEVAYSAFQVYVQESDAKVNELNLIDEVLAVEDFTLSGADVQIIQLADTTTEEIEETVATEDSIVHIALGDWVMEIVNLQLIDCSFSYANENAKPVTSGIDFNHLALSQIQLHLSEVIYAGDSIQGTINHLALHEKSGFATDTLQTSFLFSSYEITLNNLLLKTPHSTIRNKFAMQYNTLDDFSDFEEKVKMQAHLENTIIHTNDLAFFAPSVHEYETFLQISTDAKGTLENLKAKNLDATFQDIGGITGEISMKGLPDIEETFIVLDMKPLHVNMNKLNNLTGGSIPQNILELGEANYTGNFTGFIDDFVLLGNVQTSAGNAITDINYKYDKTTKTTLINGRINTETLHVGKLTGNEKLLGEISADTKVQLSMAGDKINADVESAINKITLNGYTYQNISINGEVKDKLFDGKLSVNDPNLKLDFSGKIDLNSEVPTYDFVSDVQFANLHKLHYYDKELQVALQANLNVSGKNLDDLSGNAVLNNITIKDESQTYTLKTFTVNAGGDSLKKNLSIRSDLLDADFNGMYSLSKLPSAIQDMITIYVQGGMLSNEEIANAQNVEFSVQVKDVKTLTRIFYPSISQLENLKIEGDLNSLNKTFFSRATAESLIYNGIAFQNSAVEIYTKNNTLNFFTQVKKISITDSLFIASAVLEGDFSRDSVNFNLKLGRDTDPERLNLYTGASISDTLIKLNILPSEIYLNNERWEIEANNSLQYDYNTLAAENFTLKNENKSIGLTSTTDKNYGNILKFQMKNILIEDITNLINYDAENISGAITANVNMGTNFSQLNMVAMGSISDFVLNGEKLGDADVTASVLYPNQHVNFNVMLKGENKVRINGFYDTDGSDSLVADAQITKIPLSVAEPFTRGLFSELQGDLSGELQIRGTLQLPEMKGFAEVKKGGIQVDYIGTTYYFPYLKLDVASDKISIPQTRITDKFNNEGAITGAVLHKNFDDFYFDNISINSPKLLFMETTRKQNPDFWGTAIGSANVVIDGPLDNLSIFVNATPLKDDNIETIVYLPTFGTGNVSKHDFINFVNRSDTITSYGDLANSVSIVNFDMFIDMNQDAKVNILLNSEETDVLEAKARGTLNIKANTIDKLEMFGTLSVTEGNYNFSFENLLTKEFTLKPGGTIEFSSNPYKAKLDLTAIYAASKVKESSLTGITTGIDANAQVAVDVLIKITGLLESPEINFDLYVPGRSAGSLSAFDQKLQEVLQDKNELNKQVFGLLWSGQFISSGSDLAQNSALSNPFQSGVNSTMSEFFTNQLSSLFTDWISEIFPNAEIDLGYSKIETGQLGTAVEDRQQFDIAVQQKLFNDKIVVRIGGTYDYTQATTSASNLAGDFELEYKITPDGRISVKVFRRSEFDEVGLENDTKTGLGLFYTKDFNNIQELFGKKEKEIQIK